MPLDPSIPLRAQGFDVQPAIDNYRAAQAQRANLQDADQQRQIRAEQLRAAKLQSTEDARKAHEDDTIRGVFQVNDISTPEGRQQSLQDFQHLGLGHLVPDFASKFKAAEAAEKKAAEVARAAQREEYIHRLDLRARILPGAKDQTSYKSKLDLLTRLGDDLDGLEPDYNPDFVKAHVGESLSHKERLELDNKAMDAQVKASNEAFDRQFKNKQLAQAGANIAKDNELAAAKQDLAKHKSETELARKAIDVNEVEAQADSTVALIDQMIGSDDGKIKQHPGFGGFVGAKGPSSLWGAMDKPFSGTDAASFSALYDQVKGNAFLGAVEKMRGLGALGEKEGAAATSAATRMQGAQSEKDFIAAAKEYRTAVKSRKGRVIAKANAMAGAPAAKLTKNADGSFDYNPDN